jgi:hypothetical protein
MVDAQMQTHMAGGTGDAQCTSTKVQGMHRQTLGLHKHHPQCKGEQEGVSGEDRACTSPIPGCMLLQGDAEMWGPHECHCDAKGSALKCCNRWLGWGVKGGTCTSHGTKTSIGGEGGITTA